MLTKNVKTSKMKRKKNYLLNLAYKKQKDGSNHTKTTTTTHAETTKAREKRNRIEKTVCLIFYFVFAVSRV